MKRHRHAAGIEAAPHPVVNTHLHLPPNFSAFSTAEDAVLAGEREGARVLGASNFLDQRVYGRFILAAQAAGIVPILGIEMITLDEGLRAAGTRVNDPANPGRMYLCGKGIRHDPEPGGERARLSAAVRNADERRMRALVDRVAAVLAERGVPLPLDYDAIAADVAAAAGVPADWVILQERHLARAVQQAIFSVAPAGGRAAVLAAAYAGPPTAVDDPVAVQGELRARLMKAGTPGFVPESPVSFADAYRFVLAADGIPCYPVLADGADPICPWETPPQRLADRLVALGIHAAELIPGRNRTASVDAYVDALRAKGLIVLAGTEHNTAEQVPIDPGCADGEPSAHARATFWEGTCVVVAHQHRRRLGLPGFVGPDGRPDPAFASADERIGWYAALGAGLLEPVGAGR
ncbi:MAG TPA: hypothetical protein VES19_14795 [Candidatus Limnocylindrales bacterium]|nr:hypothetical protein [Candidatus Limnocylindrales bacterium]